MFDYEFLRLTWWLLLGVLLIGFAIMDGFDLGVGALFRFIGRTDDERKVFLETIEPVWEGNQVWFILGGGAVFAAWPLLYAASFSGLYFAMLLVLLSLILRPVGFVFRNKLTDPRWHNVWDWALCISGAAPSLLFGVAFGNLFLGLPFHIDNLARPIYTGSFFGLLHPFALIGGLVSLSMLLMHGGAYAALKAEEPLAERARRASTLFAILFIACFSAAGIWLATGIEGHNIVSTIDPNGPSNPLRKTVELSAGGWLSNMQHWPLLWLAPLMGYLMAVATILLSRAKRDGLAFISSSLTVASVLLTAGIALFPFLMPSATEPGHGLTVWDASSSELTLGIMLVMALIFVPIILAYTSWVFRVLRGRITLEHIRNSSHY